MSDPSCRYRSGFILTYSTTPHQHLLFLLFFFISSSSSSSSSNPNMSDPSYRYRDTVSSPATPPHHCTTTSTLHPLHHHHPFSLPCTLWHSILQPRHVCIDRGSSPSRAAAVRFFPPIHNGRPDEWDRGKFCGVGVSLAGMAQNSHKSGTELEALLDWTRSSRSSVCFPSFFPAPSPHPPF